MRKANTASIFVIASAVSLLLISLRLMPATLDATAPIQRIVFEIDGGGSASEFEAYRQLIGIREGEPFDRQKIRISIDNLYKTENFDRIEVRMKKNPDASVDLVFGLVRKKIVRSIRFSSLPRTLREEMQSTLVAVKRSMVFESSQVAKAEEEIRSFLASRGYARPRVGCKVVPDANGKGVNLEFEIAAGERARIRSWDYAVDDAQMKSLVLPLFRGVVFYVPSEMQNLQKRIADLLLKNNFFFHEIVIGERPVAGDASSLDVSVQVRCGYKYQFLFKGISDRTSLIRSVWEKRVFEKWAMEEAAPGS